MALDFTAQTWSFSPRTASKRGRREDDVPVYSTTVDLSVSELNIYQSRVIAMLGGRSGHSVMKFDTDLDEDFDCIKLIQDYGKRLSFG